MPIYEGRAGQGLLSSPVRRGAISGRLLVGFSRNTCAVGAKRFASTFFNSLAHSRIQGHTCLPS
jgi:hypothetical protein